MTQEEKGLLLKDLYARLPYGVRVHVELNEREREWYGISGHDTTVTTDSISKLAGSNFRPYLRPMSSMTDEEEKEFQEIKQSYHFDEDGYILFDWLNKKGFDYRGLIPMGLALEALEGMYKLKE